MARVILPNMGTPTLENNQVTATLTHPDMENTSPSGTAYRVPLCRAWYWGTVPLLAIAAYVTVLRIGFLQDDFVLLLQAKTTGVAIQTLLPRPD